MPSIDLSNFKRCLKMLIIDLSYTLNEMYDVIAWKFLSYYRYFHIHNMQAISICTISTLETSQ